MKNTQMLISLLISLLFTLSSAGELSSSDIKSAVDNAPRGNFKNSIASLYKANKYSPLWVGENNKKQFSELLNALGNPLFNYKFKPFNQEKIIDLSYSIDSGVYPSKDIPRARAKLDILLSESYLKLIYFIRISDVDWNLVKKKLHGLKTKQDVHASWEIKPKYMPSVNSIIKSINDNKVKRYLSSMLPLRDQYNSLLYLLKKYRNMPKFKKVAFGRTIKRGRTDSRLRQIKKILQFTGEFPKSSSTGEGFTRDLIKAIRHFKKRFNLAKGDYIDNKFIKALNTSKEEYIRKIISNLDRLKLYPSRFESRHVEVNIPEFKLRYLKDGRVDFESNTIVGRMDRPTPIFSNSIRYMVLNPTWTITDNLVRRDLIPMLKKHPSYLQENDIHVFDSYKKGAKEVPLNINKLVEYEHNKKAIPYRFVQFPSDQNALGRVKFMFPNKYAVYLHDTDNKSLFKHRYRVFSSGCVRVKKPYEFMNTLLRDGGAKYSSSKLQSIFNSNKTTTIKLKKSIPVHFLYQTVKREKGLDYFLYDVYMYDQIVWESTIGHKKSTFSIPKERLTKINRIGARIR